MSSVSAQRPLTRVGAYAAAKAGISNLTQWLAVHMAEEYSPDIRVNAIMPGFFLTEQNRFLLGWIQVFVGLPNQVLASLRIGGTHRTLPDQSTTIGTPWPGPASRISDVILAGLAQREKHRVGADVTVEHVLLLS